MDTPIEEILNALRAVTGSTGCPGDLPGHHVPMVVVDEFRGDTRVVVPAEKIYDVLELLKEKYGFDLLVDITCVDYLNYPSDQTRHPAETLPAPGAGCPPGKNTASSATRERVPGVPADRFGLVYLLAGTVPRAPCTHGRRLTIRAFVNEPEPAVRSVVSLWEGANWLEREVWDMFGIRFECHPDLRRILMPEEFTAFPLRKDYPLQGLGERHNFPVLKRGES